MKRKVKVVAPAAGAEVSREVLIAERAYAIWEAEGRPPDAELRHWLQAEAEIRRERDGGAS